MSHNLLKVRRRSSLIAILLLLFLSSSLLSSADAFTCTSASRSANQQHHRHASSSSSRRQATSLPDLNYGLTDQEFHKWLQTQVQTAPGRNTYDATYEDCLSAIVNWRKRYRGNPSLWKRIFKKDRVIKELIESAPVIEFVKRAVVEHQEDDDDDDGATKKFTIIDLCSGKGYLSMFLSEILPKEKVDRFILVDKAWAIANKKTTTELKPHHMNWDHIYGSTTASATDGTEDHEESSSSYFTTWPIPLYTSKQDLKDSCNQRQMTKHFFNKIEGPIIILAVHLCGTLSLKAIDMFNNNPNSVKLFALKPCCLPQMVHANRGEVFRIGQHEFDARDVCSNGQFKSGNWDGPPRWHLQPRFDTWADHLFKGIDVGGSSSSSTLEQQDGSEDNGYRVSMASHDGVKVKDDIVIQVDGGFQNTYIFAERQPITPAIWEE